VWLYEGLAPRVTCSWCEWLGTNWPVLHEDETFVVLAPGVGGCARNGLTLLPKAHVPVLTELTPHAMTAVLAGLSRLSLAVRQTCGLDDLEIRTHPAVDERGDGHMHFHPVLHDNLYAIRGDGRGERALGEDDVLAIADAMAHARGGFALDESF
jgi:diadenosine tetraphosphate (Ap4A) HIT family hydrolase